MSSKRHIQLPRGYLSYSQVQLWLSDQDKYAKLYFDNRNDLRTSNLGQEYGKVVADLLEQGKRSDDVLTDTALSLIPKYDIADKEIRTLVKTKDGVFYLLSKPDSMDSATKNFLEYKTGKTRWDESKAQNHLQLKMYATGIYHEFGVIPNDIRLVWIETYTDISVDGTKSVKPTGNIYNFKVAYTLKDILETTALLTRVAKEIEVAYVTHKINPEINTF